MFVSDLDVLEAEAIYVLREAIASARNPVILFSIGKDSTVLLHLARKALRPAGMHVPLLHVDTGWKFREMIAWRDRLVATGDFRFIVHRNEDAIAAGVGPDTHGPQVHTMLLKTQALRTAIDTHHFDMVIGGARRDEDRARAKERIFSIRGHGHAWDPRMQRPEIGGSYNTLSRAGANIRVFPLSNWTERDVWRYIQREGIDVVPLYFAMHRPVVNRDGTLIMVDDHRLTLRDDEVVEHRLIRFRTLGCYPLTGAVDSTATDVDGILAELALADSTERAGRLIDGQAGDSMEAKKREGYF